ncbi:MAG: membrane-bound lytic murein transglycosylase MltF [Gallionella sp.]|jgi:membrane-bound lytic murein transglycosylase F|nr:membrane-bound lytic murein transglycosylase MltF [Gallionella sp.]
MLSIRYLFSPIRLAAYPFALILWLSLSGCHPAGQQALPNWQGGELVVLEDTLQPGADSQFNHELAKLFAGYLHAKLTAIPVDVAHAPDMLAQHRAHLAAMGFRSNTATPRLIYAPSYQTVAEQLVFNNAQDAPAGIADILDLKVAVVAGSAQEKLLEEIKLKQPSLHWESRSKVSVDDLLDEVAGGTLDVTFANRQQFGLARNFHENLGMATFAVAAPSQLAWAFAPDSDAKLRDQATRFFAEIRKDGRLHDLVDRFYGFNERLAPLDAAAFVVQINSTLPRYRALFAEAAHWSGLDWELIAALAYQESHWNPLATSFTSVRGMMMLTEDTADQMHVDNRLDARQSTLAGARYLATIRDQLPLRIAEPDRTWMALAAYNQGNGHLEDARVLTQRMGMDADRWVDVKKWMPKLTQPEYFEQLPHGYARGGEAVILVENIRMYYDMLKRAESGNSSTGLSATPYYKLLDSDKKQRIKNFYNR